MKIKFQWFLLEINVIWKKKDKLLLLKVKILQNPLVVQFMKLLQKQELTLKKLSMNLFVKLEKIMKQRMEELLLQRKRRKEDVLYCNSLSTLFFSIFFLKHSSSINETLH